MPKKISVAIIDDNETLCQSFKKSIDETDDLETIGIALNGEDGLNLITEQKPDVIVLDVKYGSGAFMKTQGIYSMGCRHRCYYAPYGRNRIIGTFRVSSLR